MYTIDSATSTVLAVLYAQSSRQMFEIKADYCYFFALVLNFLNKYRQWWINPFT
jgi:hypothetical protein